MRIKFLAILVLPVILLTCKKDSLQVDVSDVDVDISIQRLDQDLFKYQGRRDSLLIDSLQRAYGSFFELYNKQIIGLGSSEWKAYFNHLNAFLTDFRVQLAKEQVDKKYSDISGLESKLNDAFRHFKYHFPEGTVPAVYTMISGYNYSVITDSATVGIGLDNYLGRNFYFYGRLGWPKYKRYRMFREKIPSDVMQAYATMEFPYQDSTDNLINRMIHQGMVKYFVKATLPDQPDSLIFAYSEKQMDWCRDNETYVWGYFVEKKLLFSNDQMIFSKYLDPAPFTSSFSRKAPPRIGVWTGYRIVHAYMREHTDVSVAELMRKKDYQNILNNSGYDP